MLRSRLVCYGFRSRLNCFLKSTPLLWLSISILKSILKSILNCFLKSILKSIAKIDYHFLEHVWKLLLFWVLSLPILSFLKSILWLHDYKSIFGFTSLSLALSFFYHVNINSFIWVSFWVLSLLVLSLFDTINAKRKLILVVRLIVPRNRQAFGKVPPRRCRCRLVVQCLRHPYFGIQISLPLPTIPINIKKKINNKTVILPLF